MQPQSNLLTSYGKPRGKSLCSVCLRLRRSLMGWEHQIPARQSTNSCTRRAFFKEQKKRRIDSAQCVFCFVFGLQTVHMGKIMLREICLGACELDPVCAVVFRRDSAHCTHTRRVKCVTSRSWLPLLRSPCCIALWRHAQWENFGAQSNKKFFALTDTRE